VGAYLPAMVQLRIQTYLASITTENFFPIAKACEPLNNMCWKWGGVCGGGDYVQK
jgi:hypothetical protein